MEDLSNQTCEICDVKITGENYQHCERHRRVVNFSEDKPPSVSEVLCAISSLPVKHQEKITDALVRTRDYTGFDHSRSPPCTFDLKY